MGLFDSEHNLSDYLKSIDLGDGQSAKLLTRLPWDRALMIRKELAREATDPAFTDAVLRAHLWEASLKDTLTGEEIGADDYGRANPVVIDRLQAEAFTLFVAWSRDAYPKAKAGRANGKSATSSSDASPPPVQ